MIKLGYSTGVSKTKEIKKKSLKERAEMLFLVEKDAIELGYTNFERLQENVSEEAAEVIRQFNYVSIHAPVLISKDPKVWMRYPSKEGCVAVEKILKIAERVDADTILFHPDEIDDFDWLSKKIGDRLAFENMDGRKSFGKTAEDLKEVFEKVPNAKWVCDVNHFYTIDESMEIAEEFHENFHDRLCHYHLSGFGGHHEALHISKEDVILRGVKDFSVPIINEGGILRADEDFLLSEHEYILARLKQ